jgi:hypothetical protein
MTDAFQFSRRLAVLAAVLPLAALVGYFLATPEQADSLVIVSLLVGSLLLPVFLVWHHPMLIFGWNAAVVLTVLPGQPALWIALAVGSLGISIIARGLHKRSIGTYIPSIAWSLIFLAVVVLVTASLNGGLGLKAAGSSSYGGKRYFLLLIAIVGYFALTSQRIPIHLATRYVSIFLGSGLTALVSNIVYLLGPGFYFLFLVFPVDLVTQQVLGEYFYETGAIVRWTGFSLGAPAIAHILLARYGMRGVFSLAHPWRFLILFGCLFLSLLGGFRSNILMLSLLLVIQFFVEGLHRTRLVLYLGLMAIILGSAIVPLAKHLPLSVQRSLSILPIEIDPVARANADVTTEWRLRLWGMLWPQVPQYLLLGKGCAIDPSEMYLVSYAAKHLNILQDDEWLLMGAYHSGPLTILIQFGGFAALAFLWFITACFRTLYYHFRNGPPELRLVNTFLLSYFAMRIIYFLFIYGHFAEDFFIFTGLIGLSVSINGNMKKAVTVQEAPQRNSENEKKIFLAQPLPNHS